MAGGIQANVQGWDAEGVYQRWETVGKHALQLAGDHRHAFNDAHIGVAAAALTKDPRAAALVLSECEVLRTAGETSEVYGVTARRVGREVCLPLVLASMAWRAGNSRGCVELLLPLRYRMQDIGGSRAQRDLWSLLLLRAAVDAASASSSASTSASVSTSASASASPDSSEASHGVAAEKGVRQADVGQQQGGKVPGRDGCFYARLAAQLCNERAYTALPAAERDGSAGADAVKRAAPLISGLGRSDVTSRDSTETSEEEEEE